MSEIRDVGVHIDGFVDAYVDVKNEGKTKVNSLLKRNMGPLDGEMVCGAEPHALPGSPRGR